MSYEEEVKKLENMSENEKDPRLRFDAFTAGMQDGGLRSVTSISLIVCYIIANIDGKVTADNIINTIDEGMIANHFEISDAISRLKKGKVILEDKDGALHINGDISASVDLIEKDLPFTIREKSIRICQKIIAKETYRRENKVEIIENGKGYSVILRVSDIDTDYMVLNLYASSITQAEMIKEKFITNPVKVYENLIDGIFNNEL